MSSAQTLTPRALDLMSTLIGFDTTSRLSNLALIEWVEAYLDGLGVAHRRVPNPEGTKTKPVEREPSSCGVHSCAARLSAPNPLSTNGSIERSAQV